MIGLDDDPDAEGFERRHQRVGDLIGQPFLHLEPTRKHVDEAGDLGQPDDFTVWQVGDVRFAEERQHVMLAERVQLDVAHEDHRVVGFREHRVADDALGRLAIARRQPAE